MKAVFTTKQTSAYDDAPELRYHFPRTYLAQVNRALGDFIIYYEPRRTSLDLSSRGGRQSYSAVARLERIEPDPRREDHYYGHVTDYLDFDQPVPFSQEHLYFETSLQKDDGSTNRGAFGRAVRSISDQDFERIIGAGYLTSELMLDEAYPSPPPDQLMEPPAVFERPVIESVVSRLFRDRAFARHVQSAYSGRCAVTGIRLINGGGRPEAQAAHIRPVADRGPDSVRNGIALSSTVHWMFDRGLLSIDDDYRVIQAKSLVPEEVQRLLHPSGMLIVPEAEHLRPHRQFLEYHRDNVFRG